MSGKALSAGHGCATFGPRWLARLSAKAAGTRAWRAGIAARSKNGPPRPEPGGPGEAFDATG
jgi:hypothetical protein